MNPRATISLALAALLRNRMRSALTMLGVVIGVAAVLMMESLGKGATAYIEATIAGMGSNILMVVPGSAHGRTGGPSSSGAPLFGPADLEALRRGARDVGLVSPVSQRPLRTVAGGLNRSTPVSGVSPDFLLIRGWSVVQGRTLSADDERQAAQVCVVGHTIETALFSGSTALGKELRIHDVSCRVVGVLESKGASAFGMDQDDVIFMPFSTFSRRITGTDRIGLMMAAARSADRIDDAKAQITNVLRQRRHVLAGEEDDFSVRDPREVQAVLGQVTGMLTTFLLGVAGISLLVGGIGIMNIMLVSVTERTREIGIRLAVGARSADILSQFLVEAVVLSALGGMVGIGLGLLASVGLARAIQVPFVVPGGAVPIAFGVSVLVGVVFGVFPARKAARLNPLAALRFE
ncbi:MAG: ABC transporter permease [Myxococcaceae bacterium]|nr:ABC transporter permease [Myxococcaceae bacterium]